MCLISKFGFNKVTIELHLLSSLFNIGQDNPGLSRFVVNSGNEYLLGARLPYFPRGGLSGPGPCNIYGQFQSWQTSGGWGGLSAGPGMIYPVQSVDGEIHRFLGGRHGELRRWIEENVPVKKADQTEKVGRRLRRDRGEVLCRTGEAVWSPIFVENERTEEVFSEGIIHTVAPYNSDLDRDLALENCYYNSISLAAAKTWPRSPRIVTPLLGTGVKNISLAVSTEALGRAVTRLVQLQPECQCSLDVVLQPTPGTDSEIQAVRQRLAMFNVCDATS